MNWRMILAVAGMLGLVVLVLIALLFRAEEKPISKLMQEAVANQAAGKHEAAAIHLKSVLAREPDNLDANLLIGKAYLANGALLDAEKALKRAKELNAPALEVTPLLVEALIGLDRHEEALTELAETTKLAVGGTRGALLRGRAFLGLGNLVEAKTQFAVARSEAPAEAVTGLARVMMAEGDPDGARKLIDEVTARFPKNAGSWVAKGDLLRGLGESDAALAAYRQAQSVQSDNLEAALGVAVTLIGQDAFGEARKELRKARAISGSNHLIAFAEAVLAYREKRIDDCREALQAVLSVAPKHMPSVLLAGTVNFALGDVEHAHNAFVTYLNNFPGNVQARKMHAITLLRKQQPQAAVDSLTPFVELDIRDAEFFLVAGQAFIQVGEVNKARQMLAKASRLNPSSAVTLTDLGVAHISGGDSEAGIAALKKAVDLAPKDPRADRHLALALLARGRNDEALTVADRLEKRLPRVPESHWVKGIVFAVRNDKAKALEYFERALKVSPAFYPAAAALAEFDAKDGLQARSRARFEAVLQNDPRSWEANLALAQLDAQEGRVAEAIAKAQRAAADFPGEVKPQSLLARLHLQAEKIEDALGAARRARELGPRDPSTAELLGQVQLAAGDVAGAVLSFTTLVNMRPRYISGRIQLSQAQRLANERRAAIATAQDALAIVPGNMEVLGLLGSLLLEEKRYDEVLKVAAQGLERHPRRALGHALEGEVRLAQKDPKQALAAFLRADALEATGLSRIRIHQAESAILGRDAPPDLLLDWIRKSPQDTNARLYSADALVRLGRVSEALPHYLDVLKVMPRDFRVLNNIADGLMRQGDPKALDYAQQAFQIRPTDPIVAATLGAVLLQTGKLYEAVQILQKATQLDPANGEIRYQFIQALAKAGDRARARIELNALLASGKEFPQIAEARVLARQL